jgi:hypothetical protein
MYSILEFTVLKEWNLRGWRYCEAMYKEHLKDRATRFSTSRVFMNQFPPSPVLIFFKILGDICSSICTTVVVDSGKWKKYTIRKVFIILFGHLWVVELT